MKKTSYLYIVAVITGLFAIVLLGRWVPQGGSGSAVEVAGHYYQKCALVEGCSLSVREGRIELGIKPASLPALETLALDVRLEGLQAEWVSVEFVGRDMAMEGVPIMLQKQDYSGSVGHYKGTGSIAFCTVDKHMVWLARVKVKMAEGDQVIDFELHPELDAK